MDGQLKFAGINLLHAAQLSDDVEWITNLQEERKAAPAAAPMATVGNAAAEPASPPEGLKIPKVSVLPAEKTNPLSGTPVEPILNGYVQDQSVVPVGNQAAPVNDGSKIA